MTKNARVAVRNRAARSTPLRAGRINPLRIERRAEPREAAFGTVAATFSGEGRHAITHLELIDRSSSGLGRVFADADRAGHGRDDLSARLADSVAQRAWRGARRTVSGIAWGWCSTTVARRERLRLSQCGCTRLLSVALADQRDWRRRDMRIAVRPSTSTVMALGAGTVTTKPCV